MRWFTLVVSAIFVAIGVTAITSGDPDGWLIAEDKEGGHSQFLDNSPRHVRRRTHLLGKSGDPNLRNSRREVHHSARQSINSLIEK
jgi:hypothetical protein